MNPAHHTLTLDGGRPKLKCHAPVKSLCHAVYDCDCITYCREIIDGDRPRHSATDMDHTRHYGRFNPHLCEWVALVEESEVIDITHEAKTVVLQLEFRRTRAGLEWSTSGVIA